MNFLFRCVSSLQLACPPVAASTACTSLATCGELMFQMALQPEAELLGHTDAAVMHLRATPFATLPLGGRAAILIRGQAFRSVVGNKQRSCEESKLVEQLKATSTLVSNVIEPLEAKGYQVDLIVSSEPGCKLMRDLLVVLGQARVLGTPHISSSGQGQSIRKLLDVFKSLTAVSNYDYVFVVRHDLIWKMSITAWNTDFKRLNFASWCNLNPENRSNCMSDIVQVMPGRLFEVFDAVVGQISCSKNQSQAAMMDHVMCTCCFDTNLTLGDYRNDTVRKDNCHYFFDVFQSALQELEPKADVGVLFDFVAHFQGQEFESDVNPHNQFIEITDK